MKNYFSVERDGKCWDHVLMYDHDGEVVFKDFLSMSYDEMKNSKDLEEFVVAFMYATDEICDSDNKQTVVTLVGEDDVFIWGIIMGPDAEDGIRYVLVDWKKDGKSYRYEN